MIITKIENLETKAKAINQTWAPDCDKYVFIAKPSYFNLNVGIEIYDENYLPMFHLPNYQESFDKLTDKVYEALKFIYSKYIFYEWYVKADDDTLMLIDNLRSFLKDKKSTSSVTYGLILEMDDIESGYLQGGAGYVISNTALKSIGNKLTNEEGFCPNSGREDTDLAKCFRKLSIYTEKTIDENNCQRFQAFGLKVIFEGRYPSWFYQQHQKKELKKGIEAFSNTTISVHGMTPINMIKFYYFWRKSKKHSVNKKFGELVDLFLKNA